MNKQSEHDAVGAALAVYEHALDVMDDLLGKGTATDRELQDAQDDVDNVGELLQATRIIHGVAARHVREAPALPAETRWLREVILTW